MIKWLAKDISAIPPHIQAISREYYIYSTIYLKCEPRKLELSHRTFKQLAKNISDISPYIQAVSREYFGHPTAHLNK